MAIAPIPQNIEQVFSSTTYYRPMDTFEPAELEERPKLLAQMVQIIWN